VRAADLFPPGRYRFHAGLQRCDPGEFFRGSDPTGTLLSERRRWLAEDARRYAALRPEGKPLLEEFAQCCRAWGASQSDELEGLGASLEPDFLLLSPDPDGSFVLRGGVLCFPTGWALEEKVGHEMRFIHGPVPGLNDSLGTAIDRILAGMGSDGAVARSNWGIAACDELNLHPSRSLPTPDAPVDPERLWLRLEHQALIALPQSRGVVFGIRIELRRLDEIAKDAAAASGLANALETMPEAVAAYKRLDRIRLPLVALLRA